MVLLKNLSDSWNAFLRKMRKQEEGRRLSGGLTCPFLFLQLVSLEQSQAIASALRSMLGTSIV